MTTPTPAETLARPLTLPCGAVLPNRFIKSAMSETLGTLSNEPTERLAPLYQRWAEGGTGLLVTGNVFVHKRAVGEARAIAFDDRQHLDLLARWARAGRAAGAKTWVQINHAGKQVPKLVSAEPVAPSAVALDPKLQRFFNPPRELSSSEIWDIVEQFGRAAAIAREAGFDGVQIHGAHGYLVSQFLSPRHNLREDEWGGSAERRRRFALEVYKSMRAAVGADFPVAIKINSADFLRGGFSEDESLATVRALAEAGIDLIELSGGSYEKPAMMGAARSEEGGAAPVKASTAAREAHFIAFAERVRREVDVPLAVTGGFRSAAGMADAVESGAVDMVGLARALVVEPDLPRRVLAGEAATVQLPTIKTGIKQVDELFVSEMVWYQQQIHRMARGKPARKRARAWSALLRGVLTMLVESVRRRQLLSVKTPRGLSASTAT